MRPRGSGSPWLTRYCLIAAFAYVAAALVVAIVLTPRVPYADSWAHYLRLLTTPFPANVLYAENGHPEWFANAVRLLSLRLLAGDETLQIVVGLLLASATWSVLIVTVWRDVVLTPLQRAATTLAVSLGIFWLGNARALLHDNETLHVYSVLLCVAVAIAALRRVAKAAPSARGGLITAVAACALATFNFGSGVAAFVAVLAILFVKRAGWRDLAVVAIGFAATMIVYRALPGSAGVPVTIDPWPQFLIATRSLAAPLIYLLWPLLDTRAAVVLPAPLDAVGIAARAWTRVFGDIRLSVWPQACAGAIFVAALLHLTWQARREDAQGDGAGRSLCCGLALAWFGAAVAALIGLTRLAYFAIHFDQVYAPRYLPWSSLAWAGLLIATIARRRASRTPVVVIFLVSIAAIAAEVGMTLTMRHAREVADDTALAAVVGVWPDTDHPGEIDTTVTVQASAAMREARVGPFAWPEAGLIGESPPPQARAIPIASIESTPVVNAINKEAVRVVLTLATLPCEAQRVLLAEHGRVVGLARRIDRMTWRGAAQTSAASALNASVVCVR